MTLTIPPDYSGLLCKDLGDFYSDDINAALEREFDVPAKLHRRFFNSIDLAARDAVDTDVPLPIVKGVTKHAYSHKQIPAKQMHATSFSGSSTPEPEVWAMLVLLLLLTCYILFRSQPFYRPM